MKKLMLIFLLLPTLCQASEILCYSGKKTIYHGYVHDIEYTNQYIVFTENKTNKIIAVFADCVIII